MAGSDIDIKLKLDGEKEMRASLKDVNSELKLMQSGLKLTETATKGQANSAESLRQKVDALAKVSEVAGKKQQQLAKYVEDAKKKQAEAKKAVDDLKASGTANAEEVAKAEQAYQKLTSRVNYWETELNKATNEQIKADQELEKTQGYLKEADESADGLAKSIDEYGKETKEADKETAGLNEQVGALTKMEAVSKIADKLSGAFKKLNDAAADAAKELDKGYDTIIQKTGATGDALEDLKDIADDVYSEMPESMEDVGKAVGEVNTRFKLTGNQLRETSQAFLRFAKLNGTDVSSAIDSVQKAMAAFGLDAQDAEKVLEVLNRTGQNTGVNMSSLASALTTNAAAFQQLGLDIYEASDFMGSLEVSGADANAVLTGMKKALKEATDQGKPLNEALADLEDTIVNGTSDMDGLSAAYEIFGTRSGAQVFQAVKNGQISFTDLADSTSVLADATGTLNSTYEATLSSWDQWTVAQNNLKIAGAELSESFQTALTPAAEALTDVVKEATERFKELPEDVQTTIAVVAGVGGKAAEVAPQIASLVTQITALKVAKKMSGEVGGLRGSLSRLGSTAKSLGIISLGVAAIGGTLAVFKHEMDHATEATRGFAETGKGIQEGYSGVHDELKDFDKILASATTNEEKMQIAQEYLTAATDAHSEALAVQSEAQAQQAEKSKKLTDTMQYGYNAVGNDIGILKKDISNLDEAIAASSETVDQSSADIDMLTEYIAGLEEAERTAATTIVDAEGQVVEAKNASITASGQELAAYTNLSEESQALADKVSAAVLGMKEAITAGIESQISWFDAVKEKSAQNVDDIRTNLEAQIADVKAWEENLAFLADQGINQNLLQYLADLGPDGSAYVQAFVDAANGATETGLDEMNALWEEKLQLEQGINADAENVYNAVGSLAAGGKEKLAQLAEDLNASAQDTGKSVVLGMAEGIQTAQEEATDAAEELGEETVDAVADGAQTHSPSKATTDTGKNVALGMRNGINQGVAGARSAAANLGKQVVTAIRTTVTASVGRAVATTFTTAIINGITAAQSRAQTAGRALARNAASGAVAGANESASKVTAAGTSIASKLASGISTGATANTATASGAGSKLASAAINGASGVNVSTGAVAIGAAIANGVASGITNNQAAPINAAINMATAALNAAKKVLGIKSPSKVFEEEVGAMAAKGLEIGFDRQIDLSVDEMAATVSNSFNMPDLAYYAGSSRTVNEIRVYIGDKELSAVMTQAVIAGLSSTNRSFLASQGRRY